MNQLEKAKEFRRNATNKNLTERKEVHENKKKKEIHEDNINHLIIRHT